MLKKEPIFEALEVLSNKSEVYDLWLDTSTPRMSLIDEEYFYLFDESGLKNILSSKDKLLGDDLVKLCADFESFLLKLKSNGNWTDVNHIQMEKMYKDAHTLLEMFEEYFSDKEKNV